MQINKLEKKLKVLQLFNRIKSLESKKALFILAEKKDNLTSLNLEKLAVSQELREIETDILGDNSIYSSSFNFQQKLNYAISLDARDSALLDRLSCAENEIAEVESKLKRNVDQKNKIEEKINAHKNLLRQQTYNKFLVETS